MSVWAIVVTGGLATYAMRASFVALGDRVSLPDRLQQALRYVAPAAFAAIATPAVLGGDLFAEFSADIPRIVAILMAGFVVYKTRNVPLSLATGLGVLWLLLITT